MKYFHDNGEMIPRPAVTKEAHQAIGRGQTLESEGPDNFFTSHETNFLKKSLDN